MNRRGFLASGVGLAGGLAALDARAQSGPTPFGQTGVPLPNGALPLGPLASHYPEPRVQVLDKRFPGVPSNALIERVASGLRWAEGPAYFPASRQLLFSDVANNRIMRLLEDDNHLSVFRQPSMNANGNTVDREGRLITCEHAGRRVTRTEHNGGITVLADRADGKRLNSPNDVAVAPDGSIWFSDPTYGLDGNYEAPKGVKEQASNNVYRIDPKTGQAVKVADGFDQPNGLTFSPDGRTLYVVDSDAHDNVRAFETDLEHGKLGKSRVFLDKLGPGNSDGLRCDTAGNIWCSYGWGDPKEDGVRCYAPDGTLLAKISLPEVCANLTFGGALRNRLYICASTSVYALYVNAQGA